MASLYLAQNYLSGIAKDKPAFRELAPVLRELSHRRRLPDQRDRRGREVKRRMAWVIEHELPERHARPSDRVRKLAEAV